jgi:radical SAM protein with 4Fe4S-binding SPASM domain
MLNTNDTLTLQVSLDGSTEEVNARTRGAGNFAKTIEFARRMPKRDNKPLLKMTVSQNNIDDVEAFYCLAVSLGFIPEYAFITRRGNAGHGWNDLRLTPKEQFDILRLIGRLNDEYSTEAFLPLCTSGCPYAVSNPQLSLCITPDGAIHPCSLLSAPEFSLGNIYNFDEEFFIERVAYITELALKREAADYNCENCIIREGCRKGCMAAAFLLNGDLFDDDGNCELRKMQFVSLTLKDRLKS